MGIQKKRRVTANETVIIWKGRERRKRKTGNISKNVCDKLRISHKRRIRKGDAMDDLWIIDYIYNLPCFEGLDRISPPSVVISSFRPFLSLPSLCFSTVFLRVCHMLCHLSSIRVISNRKCSLSFYLTFSSLLILHAAEKWADAIIYIFALISQY